MKDASRIPLKKQLTIKRYVREGYSANEIQRKLKKQHRGVRRTVLLAYVRKVKRKPPPKEPRKYMPKSRTSGKGPKTVVISGVYQGRYFRHRRRGRGKDLYYWIRKQHKSGLWDYIDNITS